MINKHHLIFILIIAFFLPIPFCYAEEKNIDWDMIDARLFFTLKHQNDNSDAEIYQAIGVTHFQKKNWDRSEKHLQHAVELDPELHMAWYYLGLINIDTETGHSYFERATQANPDFSTPYYWMAYYRCRHRKDEQAIILFKKYIEIAEAENDEEEIGRVDVAKEVLQDLLEGTEGQSLSLIRARDDS
jgi:tetratricopeptide (TPR) repeat protein